VVNQQLGRKFYKRKNKKGKETTTLSTAQQEKTPLPGFEASSPSFWAAVSDETISESKWAISSITDRNTSSYIAV
jgi:hypothetical protein